MICAQHRARSTLGTMKRLALMMLIAGISLSATFAATINCPTCSQADFQNAVYNLANDGDVIVLPAGSATWGDPSQTACTGNNGTIFITKNITVVGQGDCTVITLADTGATFSNGVIAIWSASTFKSIKILFSTLRYLLFPDLTASSLRCSNTGRCFGAGCLPTEGFVRTLIRTPSKPF